MTSGDHTRKMVLTEEDISAIVDGIQQRRILHVCRYDIEPERMQKLFGFVEAFYDGAVETRRAFRATMIRMIVWGSIAGFIALLEVKFRWIRPMLKAITGMPG